MTNETPTNRQGGTQLDVTLATIPMPQSAAERLAEHQGAHPKSGSSGADLARHMDTEAARMATERAKLRDKP